MPRLPRELLKERQMLDKLSPNQVEKALKYLKSPLPLEVPKELQELSQVEWYLLARMLDRLLEEKAQHPVQ
jgi:hypothetical protein